MRLQPAIITAVRSSLKLKLILLIVFVLGLTVGIAPWSAIKIQERQLLKDSGEHLRALQELLKALVGANMLVGDRNQVQNLMEVVGNHADIKSVRIFDMDGVIHFSSNRDERGTRLSPAELQAMQGMPDPVRVNREGNNIAHTMVQPLFNRPACFSCHSPEQKVLGMLQISLSLDQLRHQIDTLRRWALVATVITLAAIVVGVWVALTLFVDQPLQQLVDVMSRVEKGDLSVRAGVTNSDELGQLGRHFNDMISKLDTAQTQLEQFHQEQLARADRLASIGEMAAAIAHEIRNPLTGISGALSVLSRDFPPDDDRREIVRQTRLLVDRLNNTVEDILHYSRPSSPQLQNVQLDDIIARSLSLAEGEARKARIELIKEPAAPDAGGPLTVSADPHQIQQVLLNLILNAIQASTAGGHIAIRTRLSEDNGGPACASVEIEDHGKGMTPDQTAQAFQPFFSTKAHGTGLGLPIARQIVQQHRGRISLRSALGVGTCVRVELPVQPCSV